MTTAADILAQINAQRPRTAAEVLAQMRERGQQRRLDTTDDTRAAATRAALTGGTGQARQAVDTTIDARAAATQAAMQGGTGQPRYSIDTTDQDRAAATQAALGGMANTGGIIPPRAMPQNPQLVTAGPGAGGGMQSLYDQGILPRRYVGDPAPLPAPQPQAPRVNVATGATLDTTDDARAARGFGQTGAMSGLVQPGNAAATPITRAQPQRPPEGEQPQIAARVAGGEVLEYSNGFREFRSPAYVTTDPQIIDRLMQGEDMRSIQQGRFNEQIMEQNPVAARGIQVLRGVPFVGSYLDEAVGGVFGPQAGQAVNYLDAAMNAERPGQSLALNAGGTLAATIPAVMAGGPGLAGAGANMTRGARMLVGGLAGALGGATEGAIYGAGQQQGEGRAVNALQQGTVGGVLGGVLGAAAPVVSDVVQNALTRFRGATPENAITRGLGVSPEASVVVRNALNAGSGPNTIGTASDAMLVDANPALRDLLDAAVQSGGGAGGIARTAVDARVANRRNMFTAALDEILGTPEGRLTAQANIRGATSPARSDAYAAAYRSVIDYASEEGQQLQRLLRRVPASAWRQAQALMSLDGDRTLQRLVQIAEDGTVTFSDLPDVRQIDYVARALGDVAERENASGALGGTTQLGRATGGLQREIRQAMRDLVPAYGEALDTAADAIGRVRAVETGYTLLRPSTTREVAQMAIEGMSEAERTAARTGLRTFIEDQVGRVRTIVSDMNAGAEDARQAMQMLRDLSSPAARANVATLLGEADATRLFEEMAEMATSLELRAAISQNSRTAIRQSIQGTVQDMTQPGPLELLADGSPAQAARRFVQMFTGNSQEAQALREMGIFEEIARVLTTQDSEQARRALQITQAAINGQAVTAAEAREISQAVSAVLAVQGHQAGLQVLTER